MMAASASAAVTTLSTKPTANAKIESSDEVKDENERKLTTPSKNLVRCQECRSCDFKYQCPRCSFRSCSLKCCLAHKERLSCSGKRDKTAYLRISQMNESTVRSDYHFLEDVLTSVDSSKRLYNQLGGGGGAADKGQQNKRLRYNADDDDKESVPDPVSKHPILQQMETTTEDLPKSMVQKNKLLHSHPKWRKIQQIALERGTTIIFMPNVLERHKSNHSYLSKKENTLHWTVEWRLHQKVVSFDDNDSSLKKTKANTTIVNQKNKAVSETAIVQKVFMEEIIESKESANEQQYKLLLKILPCPSNQPRYMEINKNQTLQEVLKHRTVIEYPTIEIVPHDCLQHFPLMIQEVVTNDEKDESVVVDAMQQSLTLKDQILVESEPALYTNEKVTDETKTEVDGTIQGHPSLLQEISSTRAT